MTYYPYMNESEKLSKMRDNYLKDRKQAQPGPTPEEDAELRHLYGYLRAAATYEAFKDAIKARDEQREMAVRIDELEHHSLVDDINGGSLVFTSNDLRRLSRIHKAERRATLTQGISYE